MQRIRTLALGLAQNRAFGVTRERYYLVLDDRAAGAEAAMESLRELAAGSWDAEELVAPMDRAFCMRAKYDPFLPDSLLKKAFAVDQIDAGGAASRLRAMLAPG